MVPTSQRLRPFLLLVAFPVFAVLVPSIGATILPDLASVIGIYVNELLFELFFAGPLVAAAIGFFHVWGVRIRDVLPSTRDVLAAVAFVAAGWLALSGVLAAFMIVNDQPLILTEPGTGAWSMLNGFGFVLVTSAIPIEFAWRGYYQNRTVVAFRERTGFAVVAATLGYTLWHVPFRLVTTSAGFQSLAWTFGLVFLQGLAFAVAYELTRNLAFTALAQALFAEGTLLVYVYGGDVVEYAFSIGGFVVLLGAALAYRRFGPGRQLELRRLTDEVGETKDSTASTD